MHQTSRASVKASSARTTRTDREVGKLGTAGRREGRALLHARNESVRQPSLNLQLARTYRA